MSEPSEALRSLSEALESMLECNTYSDHPEGLSPQLRTVLRCLQVVVKDASRAQEAREYEDYMGDDV